MGRSSKPWLAEHRRDPYVRRAARESLRSRSAYKLLQIQEKFRLLAPGLTVVDLGAAPGGWSQVASRLVGPKGRVVAVDLLEMEPLPGVTLVRADVTAPEAPELLARALDGRPAHVILSDMAPSTSGHASLDHDRSVALVEAVLDLLDELLRPGGRMAVKVFQGAGFDPLRRRVASLFGRTHVFKPRASRPRSVETYLVARGFRGPRP